MTECWSHEPTGRPSFSTLSVELGCLLEDPVKQVKHILVLANIPEDCTDQQNVYIRF